MLEEDHGTRKDQLEDRIGLGDTLQVDDPEGLTSRGIALMILDRDEEALESFEMA
jgi:hypothetical protein